MTATETHTGGPRRAMRLPDGYITAQSIVERAIANFPARPAAIHGDRVLTYRALGERTARLGNVLLDVAGPGGVAAAFLPNTVEYIEFDVACTRAGVVRVGLPERLAGDEVTYILGHSEARVLLTSRELLAGVTEIPDSIDLVILTDATPTGGCQTLDDALAGAQSIARFAPVAANDPNYILYTSGTTGRPKGATHSHGGRAAAMVSMLASELNTSAGLTMLHLAPLTHGSGSKLIAVLARGGTNVLTDQFEPEELPAIVAATAPTHTFLVPTMIDRIVRAGEAAQRAAATFTQISFGGSPIAPASFASAIDAIGPIFTQVYGSCEAPHPITLLRPADIDGLDEHVLLSAGRVADGVAVRLTDVSEDGAGELEVSSPHLMLGYWRNKAATADVFTEDSWYRTGDLASISAEGLVTFQDRKRDLIISGGLNIYPSEVERAIATHPAVREVVVVGYPDSEWGESVMAFVVCDPPGSVSADDVVAVCRERIAGYKKPRRVEFLDQMPLGASNKVLRQALRDRLWQGEQRRIG